MAKVKSAGSNNKISFGTRKSAQLNGQKSFNKHTPKKKTYRGQGR
jgi:hypothetical protein